MATKRYPATRAGARRTSAYAVGAATTTNDSARAALAAARAAIAHRSSRSHVAYLGIPLAITASLLSAPMFVPVLIILGWWFAPHEWGWEWLVVAGRGLLGMEWALLGINMLADYPEQRLDGAIVWVYAALVLGALAYMGRAGRS